jgi:hypothetical protein
MDPEKAERHFREMEARRDRGQLDEARFRVEVAKLLFRDEQGVFWILDAEDGTWYCNRGEDWEPGDPRAERVGGSAPSGVKGSIRRRGLALVTALAVLLAVVSVAVMLRWPPALWQGPEPTPTASVRIEVIIAAPAHGSQVPLDQEVAVESTLRAAAGLGGADRVELRVDGQTVDTQSLQSKLQPGQTNLPLSQSWLPSVAGEHQVAVVVLSPQEEPLGQTTIALEVTEATDATLPEPACTPDATFLANVTIPPGTAFRPDAQMEKVWQVRNDSTCAWGVGYKLAYIEGEELGAPTTVPVPPTAAGEPADLAVTFVAPSEAGSYTSTWQLLSPEGTGFGPALSLSIRVEAQAEENLPPDAPDNLRATIAKDGKGVLLTWQDRSANEDAFRVYREDMEASIGLAPTDAQMFVDSAVTCGNTYRYRVVAFNAAGTSPFSVSAEASLPSCAPADTPPTLSLTVVPTQVLASEMVTITFIASDDQGLTRVMVYGEETGNAELDAGRIFTCSEAVCTASWPVSWTRGITVPVTIVAIARDSSEQDSEPVQVQLPAAPTE